MKYIVLISRRESCENENKIPLKHLMEIDFVVVILHCLIRFDI